jgi:hypothetical protein
MQPRNLRMHTKLPHYKTGKQSPQFDLSALPICRYIFTFSHYFRSNPAASWSLCENTLWKYDMIMLVGKASCCLHRKLHSRGGVSLSLNMGRGGPGSFYNDDMTLSIQDYLNIHFSLAPYQRAVGTNHETTTWHYSSTLLLKVWTRRHVRRDDRPALVGASHRNHPRDAAPCLLIERENSPCQ